MILEIKLPLLRGTDTNLIFKIKQLLYIISQSVPFKPNVSALANKIQVTRKTIIDILLHLADASVINTIYKDQFGVSPLQKPEKIYLENTNFIYALSPEEHNIGNVRETFFLNQLRQNHRVTYHDKADFTVNEKWSGYLFCHKKLRRFLMIFHPSSFVAQSWHKLFRKDKYPENQTLKGLGSNLQLSRY